MKVAKVHQCTAIKYMKGKTRMKSHKKAAVTVLSAALIMAQAFSSFAFYQTPESKKGLLISQQEMFSDIQALGVKQVICNLSTAQAVNSFQVLASDCKRNNIMLTMILINSPNSRIKALLPVSSLVDGVGCYAFNVLTSEGEQAVRAYAREVASYYANTVSNWVIGNEVNDGHSWDYNGISDIDQHAASYAKTFRIFYEEIKKANPEARVFIPFDMRWRAAAADPLTYTVSDYLPRLNELLKDTEYGIAWHPYPVHFFTKPEFLDDDGITDDPNTTPNINMKNLHVLTDYLQRSEMLTPSGAVRRVILTEQGYTSACENGEERQAAAITAAYNIAKENPYVDGFYLTRQVDAQAQTAVGGAFGLWTRDESASRDEMPLSKKKAWYAYQALN